jgi:hypothetical protein
VYTFELFARGTDEDVTQTYYVYIRRDLDGLYYDADDGTFKAYGVLVDGTVDLVEDPDQPGVWQLTIDLTVGGEGVFTFLPRDGLTDLLLASSVDQVYLVAGSPLVDQLRDVAYLSDAFDGLDNLQFLAENGDPIEGADIRVYTKLDFDSNNLDTPIGVSVTDHNGRWVNPVPVNTGDTYTVQFFKPYQYGPVSQEVVVP